MVGDLFSRVVSMPAEPLSEKAEGMVRNSGLRCTKARRLILTLLLKAHCPLSHHDILDALAKGSIDRVTVYRVLEAFVKTGIVHRAYVNSRTWVFELPTYCERDRCHPHFTCRICGKTACMRGAVVPLVSGLKKGYIPERQKVFIEGLCPECARHSESGGEENVQDSHI